MLVLPATKDTFNILWHKVGIYKIRVYPISNVVLFAIAITLNITEA